MKKAVLISIRPKWCALIASGEKTIEVRRTRPDLATPFKCYIYCTQRQKPALVNLQNLPETPYLMTTGNFSKKYELPDMDWARLCNGKVIGEFICDEINDYVLYGGVLSEKRYVRMDMQQFAHPVNYDDMCLTPEEFATYAGGRRMYGWHISGLTIYDEPKALKDFKFKQFDACPFLSENGCDYPYHCFRAGETKRCGEFIDRPPQSWRYVEAQG